MNISPNLHRVLNSSPLLILEVVRKDFKSKPHFIYGVLIGGRDCSFSFKRPVENEGLFFYTHHNYPGMRDSFYAAYYNIIKDNPKAQILTRDTYSVHSLLSDCIKDESEMVNIHSIETIFYLCDHYKNMPRCSDDITPFQKLHYYHAYFVTTLRKIFNEEIPKEEPQYTKFPEPEDIVIPEGFI